MRKSLILFFFFLFCPLKVLAQSPLVAINEICWMGNATSSADEWIELYNPSEQIADLQGWILKTNKSKIELQGKIKAKDFFLLERIDDQTVANIPADQIYKGALNNQGEKLILQNDQGVVIDSVDCQAGWSAGDDLTGQTMARIYPLKVGNVAANWRNSRFSGGTPKQENNFFSKEEVVFVKIEAINENLANRFVATSGQVIEKTGRKIFLAGNTDKELLVYLRKNISLKDLNIKEGENIKVQGFLSFYQSELCLYPNSREDIVSDSELDVQATEIDLAGSQGERFNSQKINYLLSKSLIIFSLILVLFLILRSRLNKENENSKSN